MNRILPIRLKLLLLATVSLISGLACGTGCSITAVKWREPVYERPAKQVHSKSNGLLSEAETLYAIAQEHETQCLDSCVDLYFEVAVLTVCAECKSASTCRCCRLHRSALNKLVVSGQHFGRLDPSRGLQVFLDGSPHWVNITHQGFVWDADDFDHLVPVGDYKTQLLRCKYRQAGVGIPLVVKRCQQAGRCFLPDTSYFPATLVMRCDTTPAAAGFANDAPSAHWSLELVDPLRVDSVDLNGCNCSIAKDTSAALAYRLSIEQRNIIASFVAPYSSSGVQRLVTIEPYQPGKIPVILVHGLLSDPYTWADMINDLSANPWFVQHFQIWVYEYPTGEAFFDSAAGLREKLQCVRQTFDPNYSDPQFARMVLVGHSMGGLVSQLQITCSGDALWNAAANRPFDQVNMTNAMRNQIASSFFFRPSPDVARVVYIGTPHEGSVYARRLIGRISSAIVSLPEEREEEHAELIESNPGVFSREVTKRIPTSIDLLNPESQLLQAMASLPMNDGVCVHSVIGDVCWTIASGRSDGVVPVESARDERAVTEKYLKQKHTKLHRDSECVREVLAILHEHFHQPGPWTEESVPQPSLAESMQIIDAEELHWLPRGEGVTSR